MFAPVEQALVAMVIIKRHRSPPWAPWDMSETDECWARLPESKLTPRSQLLARLAAEVTEAKSGQNLRSEALRSSFTHLATGIVTAGQGCAIRRCLALFSGPLHRVLLESNVVGFGYIHHGPVQTRRGYLEGGRVPGDSMRRVWHHGRNPFLFSGFPRKGPAIRRASNIGRAECPGSQYLTRKAPPRAMPCHCLCETGGGQCSG